jgi:hypothetical protein
VAVDIGMAGVGPLGLTGDTVTNFCRLVDSAPIRDAVDADNDLAVLVSADVYDRVIRNFSDLSARGYDRVDISVKSYQATAYLDPLRTSTTAGGCCCACRNIVHAVQAACLYLLRMPPKGERLVVELLCCGSSTCPPVQRRRWIRVGCGGESVIKEQERNRSG